MNAILIHSNSLQVAQILARIEMIDAMPTGNICDIVAIITASRTPIPDGANRANIPISVAKAKEPEVNRKSLIGS